MEIHLVLYEWRTAEDSGTDIVGAYFDFERACSEMHNFMKQKWDSIYEDYAPFDTDFDQDSDTYVSFGFYGSAYSSDHCWVGSVETVTVE